jgi:hypothetical protein
VTERRRILTARKILVASTGVTGVAAVGYFLLAGRARDEANYPTGNLMPPPPLPRDAGMLAAPPLPIGESTLERVARGQNKIALVRIDSEKNVFFSPVDSQSLGSSLPQGELAGLILADKTFAPGNSYVVAFTETGSGKTKPFKLQIVAVDDMGQKNVAAYRRIIDAVRAQAPKCDCPPGDPLCSCL